MLKRISVLVKSNLFFLCVLTLTIFAAWQTVQINALVQDVQSIKAEVEMEVSHMNSLADRTLYRL